MPSIPPGLDINAAKFTETERQLILRFYDETGFSNPLQYKITSVRNVCSQANAILTAAALLPDLSNGYTPITSAQLTTLATQISTLGTSSMNSYTTHSNRLTGVTFDADADPPDLSGLLGMAMGYNAAVESLRNPQDPVVDNFSPIFGSILGPAETLFDEIVSTLSDIRNKLILGNRLANYGRILGFVNRAISDVAGFITDDNAAYDTAFDYMRKYGTAVSLNAMLTSDDWGYQYGLNVGDTTTTSSMTTIRQEKSLSGQLEPSGFTGSAQELIGT